MKPFSEANETFFGQLMKLVMKLFSEARNYSHFTSYYMERSFFFFWCARRTICVSVRSEGDRHHRHQKHGRRRHSVIQHQQLHHSGSEFGYRFHTNPEKKKRDAKRKKESYGVRVWKREKNKKKPKQAHKCTSSVLIINPHLV